MKKYVVIGKTNIHNWENGTVVQLLRDSGTNRPLFERIDNIKEYKKQFVNWCDLKEIKEGVFKRLWKNIVQNVVRT